MGAWLRVGGPGERRRWEMERLARELRWGHMRHAPVRILFHP